MHLPYVPAAGPASPKCTNCSGQNEDGLVLPFTTVERSFEDREAAKMTPEERSESARKAANARWAKKRQQDEKTS